VVVKSHDDFPGVEISIAGGVGEMVRDYNTTKGPFTYRRPPSGPSRCRPFKGSLTVRGCGGVWASTIQ